MCVYVCARGDVKTVKANGDDEDDGEQQRTSPSKGCSETGGSVGGRNGRKDSFARGGLYRL